MNWNAKVCRRFVIAHNFRREFINQNVVHIRKSVSWTSERLLKEHSANFRRMPKLSLQLQAKMRVIGEFCDDCWFIQSFFGVACWVRPATLCYVAFPLNYDSILYCVLDINRYGWRRTQVVPPVNYRFQSRAIINTFLYKLKEKFTRLFFVGLFIRLFIFSVGSLTYQTEK